MASLNQTKKKSSRISRTKPLKEEKPSRTDIEENEDPVLQTLRALHISLQAGRKILDLTDAILVYYVAVVNRDSVISCVKGTNTLAELLKVERRSDAAMTVDTMMQVAVAQPMVGKIQSHMEASATDIEVAPVFGTERDLKGALNSGTLDMMLSGSAPYVEMPVDGDAEIVGQDEEQ